MLSARQFKKTVNDAASYSDEIVIEKIGDAPIQLTYANAAMAYRETYRSPERIRLRADVPADSVFHCTAKLAPLRSLAASMVTDDVRILCREDGDLLLRSAIDEKALVVSTLVRLD